MRTLKSLHELEPQVPNETTNEATNREINAQVFGMAAAEISEIVARNYDELRRSAGNQALHGYMAHYESETVKREQSRIDLDMLQDFSGHVLPPMIGRGGDEGFLGSLSAIEDWRVVVGEDLYTARIIRSRALQAKQQTTRLLKDYITLHYIVGERQLPDSAESQLLLLGKSPSLIYKKTTWNFKAGQLEVESLEKSPEGSLYSGIVSSRQLAAYHELSDQLLLPGNDFSQKQLLRMRPVGEGNFRFPTFADGEMIKLAESRRVAGRGASNPERLWDKGLQVKDIHALDAAALAGLGVENFGLEQHLIDLGAAFGKSDFVTEQLQARAKAYEAVRAK